MTAGPPFQEKQTFEKRLADRFRFDMTNGADAPAYLVFLLHGYGASGTDLQSLMPVFAEALSVPLVFLAPNAPEPCPGVPGGYQWYALETLNEDRVLQGGEKARPKLETWIRQEIRFYNLDFSRVVLIGFSQGAMMSLYTSLCLPEPVAGVVSFSGFLPSAGELAMKSPARPKILAIHGEQDPVVPFALGRQYVQQLTEAGFDVVWRPVAGLGHGIDESALAEAGLFLRTALNCRGQGLPAGRDCQRAETASGQRLPGAGTPAQAEKVAEHGHDG